MSDSVADSLDEAEEYITKFAAGVSDTEESKNSVTGHTPPGRKLMVKSNLERLCLPSFNGTKKNYLRFQK